MIGFDGAPRTPDPSWVDALHRLAPPGQQVSSLHIRWEPGDPWQPIGRWIIWELFPQVPTSKLAALRGPSPRSTGHACFPGYCACDKKRNRWVDGPETAAEISLATWQVYHETQRYGERLWVCQGTKGGHLVAHDAMQAMVCRASGMPEQPPEIGDLPHCDPDQRTWAALGALDQVRAWEKEFGLMALHPDRVPMQFRDRSLEAGERLARWLDAQYDAPMDGMLWALKRDTSIARPAAGASRLIVDPDEVHAALVQELAPYSPTLSR